MKYIQPIDYLVRPDEASNYRIVRKSIHGIKIIDTMGYTTHQLILLDLLDIQTVTKAMQEIYHRYPDIEPRIKKSEYAMLSYILCVIMHNVDDVPRDIDIYLRRLGYTGYTTD